MIPPGDVRALTRAIRRVGSDEDLRARLIHAGHRRAKAFDAATVGIRNRMVPVPHFDRDLRLEELHQSGRIGKRRSGIVGQRHERAAEARAARARIGEAQLQRYDRLLSQGRFARRPTNPRAEPEALPTHVQGAQVIRTKG